MLPGSKVDIMAAGVPNSSPFSVQKLIKTLVFLLFAFLGMFGFAMIGSLAYPVGGVGAIGGAIGGVLLGGCFGCMFTGLCWDMVPDEVSKYGVAYYLPGPIQHMANLSTHGDFTVVVTVHEVKNLRVKGLLPWQPADLYLEIECGDNPTKTTCVRHDHKFNEQFRVAVRAIDDAILIKVKDQDIFGSTDVGYVSIDVMKDIIEAGFPVQQDYPIHPWQNGKITYSNSKKADAQLILTFDHTDDLGLGGAAGPQYDENRTKWKKLVDDEWNTAGMKTGGGGNYGSLDLISKMEFNTSLKVEKELVNGKKASDTVKDA